MSKKNKELMIFGGIVVAFILLLIVIISGIGKALKKVSDEMESKSQMTLSELVDGVTVNTKVPVKGTLSLDDNSLYDELPEITKYPLSVEGKGDIDIEIFTSGEKAGKDTDSWLIDCANKFNSENLTIGDKTVSLSVRSVASGLASDYIASGKYLPDLYTPSNELFGEYSIVRGGNLTLATNRLVGNTAGLLVSKKDADSKDITTYIDKVMQGTYNIGYTNPQTSATGLNLLIELLKLYGKTDMFSDEALQSLQNFNNNIPFVAYTTQQMRDSVSNGNLDGLVTEYQAYINDENLKSLYEFIPFGTRHDNPLYIVNAESKSAEELEAIELIKNYLLNSDCQAIATKDGFNANDDYASSYDITGAEISKALTVYKENKDSGKDIIAVFVADCSGSMAGEKMQQLKSSLTNGINYINSNNEIGFVSYSDEVNIEVPIGKFDLNQKAYFQGAIDNLMPDGNTSTYEAIVVAVDMINKAKEKNPNAKTMLFLLSDGEANGYYTLSTVTNALKTEGISIYTIGYGDDADKDELNALASINEAAFIDAVSEDIIYKLKSLFNAQL